LACPLQLITRLSSSPEVFYSSTTNKTHINVRDKTSASETVKMAGLSNLIIRAPDTVFHFFYQRLIFEEPNSSGIRQGPSTG
jgi:polysaccharide pyruvyl transferase WcaK-like protein